MEAKGYVLVHWLPSVLYILVIKLQTLLLFYSAIVLPTYLDVDIL